jgi:predicted Rossmann fold flavoprotein
MDRRNTPIERPDTIVLGAGAAGLFCAMKAAAAGSRVVVLDHAKRLCEKIRISGGGRCNFTNLAAEPANFLSRNPKFCISALRSYSAADFLAEIEAAGIAWEEKALGQLFCANGAGDMIAFLLDGCRKAGAKVHAETRIEELDHHDARFVVRTDRAVFEAPNLVVATGGKSIPKIGATGFGYEIAERFGLALVETRPALVPLTFSGDVLEMAKELAGVSVSASVSAGGAGRTKRKGRPPAFRDGFLFTHRGLSGPSVLQASSYWREGTSLEVDLAPGLDVEARLLDRKAKGGAVSVTGAVAELLPKRLAKAFGDHHGWHGRLADWPDRKLREAAATIKAWSPAPAGSEGYRTAEVTLGGVDTDGLNSASMEAKSVPGLYFVGEVVDVTGWLGGYNFQWAWASGAAAARHLASKAG